VVVLNSHDSQLNCRTVYVALGRPQAGRVGVATSGLLAESIVCCPYWCSAVKAHHSELVSLELELSSSWMGLKGIACTFVWYRPRLSNALVGLHSIPVLALRQVTERRVWRALIEHTYDLPVYICMGMTDATAAYLPH